MLGDAWASLLCVNISLACGFSPEAYVIPESTCGAYNNAYHPEIIQSYAFSDVGDLYSRPYSVH